MSVTQETPPEVVAEQTADVEPLVLTTEEIAAQKFSDGSKADGKKIAALLDSFVADFGPFWEASRKLTEFRAKLADTLMQIRLSVTLGNGKPDYFGSSSAYRSVFQDRIIGMLKDVHGMPLSEAKALLDSVRVNWINNNEMVAETIIADAVRKGEIKGAKLIPADDGLGEVVEITTPKGTVLTYEPGQTEDVPAAVKKAAAAALKAANKNVPERFGGEARAPRTGGGRRPSSPAAATETLTEGFAAVLSAAWSPADADGAPNVAPLATLELVHRFASELVLRFTGGIGEKAPEAIPGGKDNVAEMLATIGGTFVSAAAAVAGKEGAKDRLEKSLWKEEAEA